MELVSGGGEQVARLAVINTLAFKGETEKGTIGYASRSLTKVRYAHEAGASLVASLVGDWIFEGPFRLPYPRIRSWYYIIGLWSLSFSRRLTSVSYAFHLSFTI